MPTLFTQGWGSDNQQYTIDLTPAGAGLAHDSARTGAVLNISAFSAVQDILVFIKAKASGAVGSDKLVNWFAAGSVDNSTFTGNVAVDTTYTSFASDLDQYPNVLFGRPVAVQDTAQQYGGPFSLALLFGGVLPKYVILGLHNRSNVALTNSDTENEIRYQVVYTQA